MKTQDNQEYIQAMWTEFNSADANRKEEIIDCLKAEGFIEEALELEAWDKEDNLNYPEDNWTELKNLKN